METEHRLIAVPAGLCAEAEEKFAGKFADLPELVTFMLTQLLRGGAEQLDAQEQKIIEDRLRDLGYL